jgi:hypothetical protein
VKDINDSVVNMGHLDAGNFVAWLRLAIRHWSHRLAALLILVGDSLAFSKHMGDKEDIACGEEESKVPTL